MPYLVNPKNGLELNWNNVAASVATDTLEFNSAYMNSCTPENKSDRQYKANLWWWHYHERHDIAPLGDIEGKEEMIEGGSLFIFEPNDVRGLAGVRQRYASGTKEDDFICRNSCGRVAAADIASWYGCNDRRLYNFAISFDCWRDWLGDCRDYIANCEMG